MKMQKILIDGKSATIEELIAYFGAEDRVAFASAIRKA